MYFDGWNYYKNLLLLYCFVIIIYCFWIILFPLYLFFQSLIFSSFLWLRIYSVSKILYPWILFSFALIQIMFMLILYIILDILTHHVLSCHFFDSVFHFHFIHFCVSVNMCWNSIFWSCLCVSFFFYWSMLKHSEEFFKFDWAFLFFAQVLLLYSLLRVQLEILVPLAELEILHCFLLFYRHGIYIGSFQVCHISLMVPFGFSLPCQFSMSIKLLHGWCILWWTFRVLRMRLFSACF